MTDEELSNRVRVWLNTQGYPLELRAAALSEQAGFETIPGLRFEDPEQSVVRQIDILGLTGDDYGVLRLAVAIECKSSSKPWIVLGPTQALGFNRLRAFAVSHDEIVRDLAVQSERLATLPIWPSAKAPVGHTFVQAFSEREDQAYGAALSAIKAAIWFAGGSTRGEPSAALRLAFPLVVVDTPVFFGRLTSEDEVQIEQVNECWLYFDHRMDRSYGTCVRVVNRAGLPKVLRELRDTVPVFEELLAGAIESAKRRGGTVSDQRP